MRLESAGSAATVTLLIRIVSETSPITAFKVFRAEALSVVKATLCNHPETEGIFMESLVEQPQAAEYFDRYLRVYNDATTWLAETLDGSMRTPFEYRYDGQHIIASDGSDVRTILEASLDDAEQLVAEDATLHFELRRRHIEMEEHDDLLGMVQSHTPNTMVVVSDFPVELMQQQQDFGGYNTNRKQTMLRVFTWDGSSLKMFTQSLDRSDREGLEAIYAACGKQPEPGELLGQRIHVDLEPDEQSLAVDRLMGVYDRSLAARYGGTWYAGRQETQQDTYRFVLGEQQLVDHFVTRQLKGGINERDRYDTAALLAKRFEQAKSFSFVVHAEQIVRGAMAFSLDVQLRQAGIQAAAKGKTFSGCGISAQAAEDLSADAQFDQAGYGNKAKDDKDKYGSLEFKCSRGHYNRRPPRKLIDKCRVCNISVRC